MKIAVGFDHAGFPLKETVLKAVENAGHEPIDMGTNSAEPVDFPDITEKVGRAVQNGEAERGIIVCGTSDSLPSVPRLVGPGTTVGPEHMEKVSCSCK